MHPCDGKNVRPCLITWIIQIIQISWPICFEGLYYRSTHINDGCAMWMSSLKFFWSKTFSQWESDQFLMTLWKEEKPHTVHKITIQWITALSISWMDKPYFTLDIISCILMQDWIKTGAITDFVNCNNKVAPFKQVPVWKVVYLSRTMRELKVYNLQRDALSAWSKKIPWACHSGRLAAQMALYLK